MKLPLSMLFRRLVLSMLLPEHVAEGTLYNVVVIHRNLAVVGINVDGMNGEDAVTMFDGEANFLECSLMQRKRELKIPEL